MRQFALDCVGMLRCVESQVNTVSDQQRLKSDDHIVLKSSGILNEIYCPISYPLSPLRRFAWQLQGIADVLGTLSGNYQLLASSGGLMLFTSSYPESRLRSCHGPVA
jgi:hypothetical protein